MTTDTQAQPTPGRIKYIAQGDANTYAILIDENDEWLMALLHNGHQATARQEANLRRLAACWNACHLIPTEHVEAYTEAIGTVIGDIGKGHAALSAECDDLLATTVHQTQQLAAVQALQAQLVDLLRQCLTDEFGVTSKALIANIEEVITATGDISQGAPTSAPAGTAPQVEKAAAANAGAQDADVSYQVIVDRRGLFDALRAAHREGQSIGQLEGAESWHKATDYADAEIKGWKTMRAAATSTGEHGDTSHVGRDLDDMPQPYAGAIVLLETIAECGALAFFPDGQRTQNSDLCKRFAGELRAAGRTAAVGAGEQDHMVEVGTLHISQDESRIPAFRWPGPQLAAGEHALYVKGTRAAAKGAGGSA